MGHSFLRLLFLCLPRRQPAAVSVASHRIALHCIASHSNASSSRDGNEATETADTGASLLKDTGDVLLQKVYPRRDAEGVGGAEVCRELKKLSE